MEESDQRTQRIAKLAQLREQGVDPFATERFERTHSASAVVAEFESLDGKPASVAGRIESMRRMGGSLFAHIRDATGRVQVYVRRDVVGQEEFDRIRAFDRGDIVGVDGTVMRTNTGEVSVRAACVTLLAKALRPLPLGHEVDGELHGTMTDPELRHRMRYVDFAVNPWTRDLIVRRSRMVSAMRRFLDDRGFLEVETPVLQEVAGGAAARPFVTHHNALKHDYKLRIALELALKRLIVGDFDRVYEVGRVFRNEGIDTSHSPEFSLLELYQAYANLDDMMDLVEELYAAACVAVNGEPRFTHAVQGRDGSVEEHVVDLSVRPWQRLPMLEGIERYAGVRAEELRDLGSARAVCARVGIPPEKEHTVGGIIEKLHEVYTQPRLVQPTFITDFPAETSPLAKKCAADPSLTRRFEVYMGTQELGNAFSEINDPLDQRERFEMQMRQLAAGNQEAHPMDEDFLRALEYGMPPTGGFGGGIDRLIMVFAGVKSIREVIAFPLLRPEA